MDLETAHRKAYRRVLLILDAVSIVVAMVTAMGIHSLLRQHLGGFKSPPALESYLLLGYLTLPLWLSLAAVMGLYRQLERPMETRRLITDLVKLHVYGLLGLTLLIYLTQIYMNRSVVGLFLILTFALMFMSRFVLHAWLRSEHTRGHGQLRVLLIADTRGAVDDVLKSMQLLPFAPHVVGCLAPCPGATPSAGLGLPLLGSTQDLRTVLQQNAVDQVLVSCSREVVLDIGSMLEVCDEVGVPLICRVQMDHQGTHAVRVTEEMGHPCITFKLRERSADALFAKRFTDISVSFVGLLLVSPLMAAIAGAILLSMGRPVLLRQQRTGYNGRVFTIYKFRTMVRDAEQRRAELETQNELQGPAFKIRKDPRITPLGRLLRRSSLDELPQLYNVLSGQMSLVGPRPLVVDEQQRISGHDRRRLSMRPGMTGLWQVSGRSAMSFEEWMRLDLEYVDNWSLALDLRLLLRTIPAVLTGRGAV